MPEGDSLHRAARRLQVLVGERVEVETPHPRAAVKGLAERLDGRRLEGVEAIGKNLLLRFEGDLVLRSHLRMNGRWRVERRGTPRRGKPWLVLRGAEHEAVLWDGPVLDLVTQGYFARASGPDILGEPPDYETMLARLRAAPQDAGSALRCSTSGSWPASGTSGRPRRCGRPASRRGGGSTRQATTSCARSSKRRTG